MPGVQAKRFEERGKDATGAVKKTPPPDWRGEPAQAWCRYCLGEIYPGEAYYRVDGRAVCVDCLPRLAEEYFCHYRTEEEL